MLKMICTAFTPITAYIRGYIPDNRVHRDVCIVQILLDFSLTWIRLIWLLAFHIPWDRSDSTLHYPLWSYIRNHWYIEEGGEDIERLKQGNYSPLLPELYAWVCIPLSLGALWFSSQACLLLMSLLSRDGGLRWWRPKWGIQFLRFADVPSKVVSIL